MQEALYKFIKTFGKVSQCVLFDAIAYKSVYGTYPVGLQDKYLTILGMISKYVEDEKEKTCHTHRGAPKGNRNNRWCRLRDSREIDEIGCTKEYNSDTKEYNSDTKEYKKEKEGKRGKEKEENSPHTPYKEEKEISKKEEKENVCARQVTQTISLDPPQIARKDEDRLRLTTEELNDTASFHARFPWIDIKHSKVMMKWLRYKKERNQAYKSEMSLKICYNQYLRYCEGDASIGEQMVDTSIGNNWSGLFALRNDKHSGGEKDKESRRQDVENILMELWNNNEK